MKAAEILAESILAPKNLASMVAQRKEAGLVAPSFFAMAGGVLSALLGTMVIQGAEGASGRAIFSTLGVALPILSLFVVLCKLALIHVFAGLWGQRGDVRALWVGLSFSWAPFLLLLPISLLLRATGLSGFFALALMILMVMGWRIEVLAIEAVYRLTRGRAIALFVLPLILTLMLVLIVLLGMAALVSSLALAAFGLVL
jgi:hypothetical protein